MNEAPVPMPEEEALRQSLHNYLDALAKRPLTPRSLVELEKVAKLARQILTVGKEQAMGTMPNMIAGGVYQGGYQMEDTSGLVMPIQSSPAETFGASLVRELVASIGTIMKPPAPAPPIWPITQMSGSDLVFAISMAHEKGLSDLEAKLTEKLFAMADRTIDSTLDSKSKDDERSCSEVQLPPHAPCALCLLPLSEHVPHGDGSACPDRRGVFVLDQNAPRYGASGGAK